MNEAELKTVTVELREIIEAALKLLDPEKSRTGEILDKRKEAKTC